MANDISSISTQAYSSLMEARSGTAARAAASAKNDDAKIEGAAKQFESILLASWLQQAEKSFATVPGDDPDKDAEDPGKDQFQQLAMQSVATSLVNSGGIGIASMIAAGLRKNAEGGSLAAAAGDAQTVEK